MSSSPLYFPQTPSAAKFPFHYKPLNSSPLLESPGKSSPAAAAQARRKSQYKSHVPSTPLFLRNSSSSRTLTQRSISNGSTSPSCLLNSSEHDPQKELARDRVARYLEHAGKARQKAVRGRRSLGVHLPTRDEFAMDQDADEDDEDIMQDELFRRIMADTSRKQKHAYRVSYAIEVGSSFDPDLEDVGSWEQELAGGTRIALPKSISQLEGEDVLTPDDLDLEELQEYAEEYARQGYIDSEDVVRDHLLAVSDGEEIYSSDESPRFRLLNDVDMDMS